MLDLKILLTAKLSNESIKVIEKLQSDKTKRKEHSDHLLLYEGIIKHQMLQQ